MFFSGTEFLSIFCYFFLLLSYFLLAKKTPSDSVEILFFLSFIIYLFFGKRFLFFFKNNIYISLMITCYVMFLNFITLWGLYQILKGDFIAYPLYLTIYYLLFFFLIFSILFYFFCYFHSFFYHRNFLNIKYIEKINFLNIFDPKEIIKKVLIIANVMMFIFIFSIFLFFLLKPDEVIHFINLSHLFLFFSWLMFLGIGIYQKKREILPQNLFIYLSPPFFLLIFFFFF